MLCNSSSSLSRSTRLLALAALLGACADAADRSLTWVEEDDHRWAQLQPPRGDRVGFEALDPVELGLDFANRLSEDQIVENRNLLNGSGVAVGDVTGDGRPDIYLARLDGPNRLYGNLGGWRFQDMTDGAGVALPDQFSTGATFADVDGDADLDLLVAANGAPTRLFLNDGAGVFTEAEGALDTGRTWGTTSLALADIDADGDLDLYAANYKERSVRDLWPYEQEFRFIVERVDGEYRVRDQYREHYRLETRDSVLVWFEEGEPDLLFRNEGEGRFTSIPLDGGVLR
ncbi:MAG: VCBS repeat-containing protein, partial [Gemmatimonadetes bacterium]|nr:VCBS repeat-containing protein [Gemmatimonadota bacterium]